MERGFIGRSQPRALRCVPDITRETGVRRKGFRFHRAPAISSRHAEFRWGTRTRRIPALSRFVVADGGAEPGGARPSRGECLQTAPEVILSRSSLRFTCCGRAGVQRAVSPGRHLYPAGVALRHDRLPAGTPYRLARRRRHRRSRNWSVGATAPRPSLSDRRRSGLQNLSPWPPAVFRSTPPFCSSRRISPTPCSARCAQPP